MEEEKIKKRKSLDKGTIVVVSLALVLGIGIGYLAAKRGERAVIRIEKCSDRTN